MYYSVEPVRGIEENMVYEEIQYNGYHVLACKTDMGYILERVYSTNPKDFLVNDLYPGKILENALIKYNFEWYNNRCMFL